MKAKTLLVAAVMFLGLSAAAYAQATFTVGSTPVTAVIATGVTEKAGDITFTIVQGSGATIAGGSITVNFGNLPLTSAIGATGIRVANCTGTFGLDQACASGKAAAVSGYPTVNANSAIGSGLVQIDIPSGALPDGSFTLTGVRVNVSGSGLTSLNATLSAVNTSITALQTNVVVINAISQGLASFTAKQSASLTSTVINSQGAQLYLKEGFNSAFGVIPATDASQTNGQVIRITMSAAPPAGVTVTFPGVATSLGSDGKAGQATWQTSDSKGVISGAAVSFKSDATSLAVYYVLTSDSKLTDQETMVIGDKLTGNATSLTIANPTAPTTPLSAATVTVTATLAPISSTDTKTLTPRYTASEVPATSPPILYSIAGSNTGLLIPYASWSGGALSTPGTYDTGIAISNTSTDPFASGVTSVPNAGTIVFTFYQQQKGTTAPKVYTYITAAGFPGVGLDATGNLPSGSTYTVLLSALLGAVTSGPTSFDGYVMIYCNFTGGHGQYVIGTFSPAANNTFYNSGQTLVILQNALRGANETLGN